MVTKCILVVDSVDESTGEVTSKEIDLTSIICDAILKTRSKKTTTSKDLVVDENPVLYLEDGKYTLTSGAINLLGITPGVDKLAINYQKISDIEYPVIGLPENVGVSSGNKINKSGVARFGGAKHDVLIEFGDKFILTPHPNIKDVFFLTSDGVAPEMDKSITTLQSSTEKYNNELKKKKEVVEEEPDAIQPEPEDSDMSDLEALLSSAEDINSNDFSL